jgi:hypothetical protein
MKIVNGYDRFMIITSLIVSIVCIALVSNDDNETVSNFSGYAIIFTHLFVLPTIYLCVKTRWLYATIILTSLFSIAYHIARIVAGDPKAFELADMASQGILIWLTMFIFIFDNMPPSGVVMLFGVGIVIASFGEIEIGTTNVDNVMCSIPMLIVICYILHKLAIESNFFKQKRNYFHVIVGLMYFLLAFIIFTVASSYDGARYNLIHATWHVCAYVALYFVFASRKKVEENHIEEIRVERTSFALY